MVFGLRIELEGRWSMDFDNKYKSFITPDLLRNGLHCIFGSAFIPLHRVHLRRKQPGAAGVGGQH